VNAAAQSSGSSASVCPFVALAEDRNRRADEPDQGNRCYAEPAPRQRDLAYQADYCYSRDFSSCSVFLAWAARNAAEPAYVTDAAQRAWGSGIAAPDDGADAVPEDPAAALTPEGGLFGPPDDGEVDAAGKTGSEQIDWVSASAWADAPWDEQAEVEAEELASIEAEQADVDKFDELDGRTPSRARKRPPDPRCRLPCPCAGAARGSVPSGHAGQGSGSTLTHSITSRWSSAITASPRRFSSA
jgi:hypothetical protein